MRSDPGLIHVSDGPVGTHGPGRYEPVPTACPECGRKTIRSGNGSRRAVYCSARLDSVWDGQRMIRKCDWGTTVYYSTVANVGRSADA